MPAAACRQIRLLLSVALWMPHACSAFTVNLGGHHLRSVSQGHAHPCPYALSRSRQSVHAAPPHASFYPHSASHRASKRSPCSFKPKRQLHMSLAALPFSLPLSPIISPTDQLGMYAVISLGALCGVLLENKTSVGKALSGAVCAMLVTSLLTNIGLIPGGATMHVASLQSFVVKVATPLLLLGANLSVIVKTTGQMLTAFLFGTLGSVTGAFLGFMATSHTLSSQLPVGDAWKLASALAAKNIGGGLNFMAVAGELHVTPDTVALGLTVDNVLGLMYFPLVAWLGRGVRGGRGGLHSTGKHQDGGAPNGMAAATQDLSTCDNIALVEVHGDARAVSADAAGGKAQVQDVMALENMAGAIALGMTFAACAEKVGLQFGVPPTLASTAIAVALASVFPSAVAPFVQAGELLGRMLLFMFFASVGIASGDVVSALSSGAAVSLFVFGLILYVTHLSIVLLAGRLLSLPLPDVLLASNANIGNPATAAAMAVSMGWSNKVLPAILVGTLGNAYGTLLGLLLGANVLSSM